MAAGTLVVNRRIRYGADARRALLAGVDLVASAVGATYGPGGRAVMIQLGAGMTVTRDGATVARQTLPGSNFARQGSELLREAADRVSDTFGDGSTTAAVLAGSLLRRSMRLVEAGHDPLALAQELAVAAAAVTARLRAQARPAGRAEITAVAFAAGGDAEVARWLADGFGTSAQTSVLVRQGRHLGVEMSSFPGFRFERGLLHPNFADPATGIATLVEPAVCLADLPLELADAGKLAGRSRWIGRPLLVITEAPAAPVLELLAAHARTSDTPVIPVGAPWQGPRRRDFLADLAAVTGATVLVPELMHSFAGLPKEVLGSAGLAVVEREATTVVDGTGDASTVAARLADLDRQIAATEIKYERDRLLERRGAMAGETYVLSVGAATDQELGLAKQRARAAVAAARAAVSGGVVAGGGLGLLRAALAAPQSDRGTALMSDAATDLLRLLLHNAGVEPEAVLAHPERDGSCDGRSGNWNAEGEAVTDAVAIVEAAVNAAVSVATVTLASEVIVCVE